MAYYEVSFQKAYPENFDTMTMFKWMDFTSSFLKENVTAFYGKFDKNIHEGFYLEDVLFSKTIVYKDGNGLSDTSYFLKFRYITIFIYIVIVFMYN
jgi:hypothetical protein